MLRRLLVAGAIAVVVTTAIAPGSGRGSSAAAAARGAQRIPAGLAAAIHDRLGAGTIRAGGTFSYQPPAFGYSVALSADGTTALVGGPGSIGEPGRLKSKGGAYIFHVSGAGPGRRPTLRPRRC